jgi:hypothetical protein
VKEVPGDYLLWLSRKVTTCPRIEATKRWKLRSPAGCVTFAFGVRQWSSAFQERGGKVRTNVVKNRKKNSLQGEVRKHVEAGSNVYRDALKSYEGMSEFNRQFVDHPIEYVRGNVHTNGLENFWSLLKRGLGGTYVSVEPFHLFRYLDEQASRFNNRKDEELQALARRACRTLRLRQSVSCAHLHLGRNQHCWRQFCY